MALEYSKKDVEENFENVDMDVDDPRPNAETADVKETTSYEKDSDQKPAKFRKTKVITSTSLTDPVIISLVNLCKNSYNVFKVKFRRTLDSVFEALLWKCGVIKS